MTVALALGAVAFALVFTAHAAYLLHLLERERVRHAEQVHNIVVGAGAERREWERERSVLLNRIQDPPAGVAASLAVLRRDEPEESPLDMVHER
jgi:hypothetical protein